MPDHTFQQPRSFAQGGLSILVGVVMSLFVFWLRGFLVNKFSEVNSDDLPKQQQTFTSVTEDIEIEEETPPDDVEEEVEEAEAEPIDISLDIPTGLSGGGIIIDTSAFDIKGSEGDIFNSSDLDSGPRPKLPVQPRYPDSLKKQGKEGRVIIELVVDADGKVLSAKVKSSSGYKAMDDAALKAAQKTKFKPANRGGKNVKAKVLYPISFKLNR